MFEISASAGKEIVEHNAAYVNLGMISIWKEGQLV